MPVLLLVVCSFILVHLVLIERILSVLRVDILAIPVGWILVDRYHDLADNIVVHGLRRQDDLELGMLSDIEDELGRDVGVVVDCQGESLGVSNGDASEVELCLLDLYVWNLCAGPNWQLECSATPDVDGDLSLEVSLDIGDETNGEDHLLVRRDAALDWADCELLAVALDMEDGGASHLVLDVESLILGPEADRDVAKVEQLLDEGAFGLVDDALAPDLDAVAVLDLEH